MAKLLLKDLSKSFNSTKVLDNVNISVNDGEFVVLVGPSGSGKSTILRIIAGLEEPTSGTVEINNKVINNLSPKMRDIAMVFQNYALYPHMTVFDNLAFPLKMKKTDDKKIKNDVNDTAELLGIKNHLQKLPRDLSGGERQRVALGRAIVRKPQIFLLDEPLSNLDAKLRVQMRAEILKLHKTLNATIIYVTHDQVEALTMGNKIAVLNTGRINQYDIPKNVYNLPNNLFVAGFVGSPAMNFFDVKFINSTKIQFAGNDIELENLGSIIEKIKNNNLLGKELILGVRPEHIYVSSQGHLKFSACIDFVEMLGNDFLLYASIVMQNGFSKRSFVFKLPDKCDFKPNDLVNLSINPDVAHYFGKETGKRLTL